MNSNIEGIFQALIPEGQQGTKQPSTVVTERAITTANQSSPQYILTNEQPSFAAKVNDSNLIGSPKVDTRFEGEGVSGNNLERTNENKSGVTTAYYNSSSVSPVPLKYQFSSSAFQSPGHNITAFNQGGNNPSSSNEVTTRTVTYTTKMRQNNDSRQKNHNGSGSESYEYKRILNGTGKRVNNDGSVSPVNNLLDGNLNGAEQKFFSTYQRGHQTATLPNQGNQSITIGENLDQNLQRDQSVTESIYEYQPAKTTTIKPVKKQPSPMVSLSTEGNGIKQPFDSQSYGSGYKPSSGNKVTFGGGHVGINGSGQSYSNVGGYNQGGGTYGATYHYVPTAQPQVTGSYNTIEPKQYNFNSSYRSQTIQPLIPPPTIQTSHQAQSILNLQPTFYSPIQQHQSLNQQIRIQNTKNILSQKYQIVDQIQRPKYEKLYVLQDTYGGRMMVQQDPSSVKGCCGPLCWLPLVLIGAVLALFGMLCGLGVICPGSGDIRSVKAVNNGLVEPLIVGNTTEPEKVVPIVPGPQSITPSVLQPVVQPSFTPGTPSYRPVTPSYIPPISIAPSANPTSPIIPNTTIPITNTTTNLPQFNASVPAVGQPVIQINPEVIRYNKTIEEYGIDATPRIVGVVTNGNSEVMNGTVNNIQGITSVMDLRTNKSGSNQSISGWNGAGVEVIITSTTTDISNNSSSNTTKPQTISKPLNITKPSQTGIGIPLMNNDTQTIPTVIDNTETIPTLIDNTQTIPTEMTIPINITIPTVIDDGWIEPFAPITSTVPNPTEVNASSSVLPITNTNIGATVVNNNLSQKIYNPPLEVPTQRVPIYNPPLVVAGSETKQNPPLVVTTQRVPTTSPTVTPDYIQLQPQIAPSAVVITPQQTKVITPQTSSTTLSTISTNNITPETTSLPNNIRITPLPNNIPITPATSFIDIYPNPNYQPSIIPTQSIYTTSYKTSNTSYQTLDASNLQPTINTLNDIDPSVSFPTLLPTSNIITSNSSQINYPPTSDLLIPNSDLLIPVFTPSASTLPSNQSSSSNNPSEATTTAPSIMPLEPPIQAPSIQITRLPPNVQPIIPDIQELQPTIA